MLRNWLMHLRILLSVFWNILFALEVGFHHSQPTVLYFQSGSEHKWTNIKYAQILAICAHTAGNEHSSD